MEAADYEELRKAFSFYWNGKIPEGSAIAQAYLDKHPAFSLIYAEEFVIKATLSEEPADYEKASQLVEAAKKKIAAGYKQTRPYLKSFLSGLGKSLQSKSTASSNEIKSNLQKLKAKEHGDRTESEFSADEEADDDEEDEKSSSSGGVPVDANLMKVATALFLKVLSAEALLWSTMLLFKQRKFVKGVFDFRKSWKNYSDAADVIKDLIPMGQTTNPEIPLFDEIRCSNDFGMGLFHFAVSAVPRAYKWLIEGVGFKGDRPASLVELERSMNTETGYRSPLSAFLLAWIHGFFYENQAKCQEILTQQLDKFPTASVLQFTSAYVQRTEGKINESIETLRLAHNNASNIEEYQLKIIYEIGTNYFLLQDWNTALENLQKYVTSTKSEAYRAYCSYQVGFCHLMLDNKDKAVSFFKQVAPSYRKNYAYDEVALRWSKKYLKKKFTDFEMITQRCLIWIEALNFQACDELIRSSAELPKSHDEKASWHYISGVCHYRMGRTDEAKSDLKAAVALEKKLSSELFVVPWSLYYYAEMLFNQRKYDGVEKLLKQVDSYSDYDFESNLNWKVKRMQEQIASVKGDTKGKGE